VREEGIMIEKVVGKERKFKKPLSMLLPESFEINTGW
jgi:hypothetical protein